MKYIYLFFCIFAAWYIACVFVRMTRRSAAGKALLVAGACVVLSFLLQLISVSWDFSPVIFVLMSIDIPLKRKGIPQDRHIALLLALGGYGMFSFCALSIQAVCSIWVSAAVFLLLVLCFVAAAESLRQQYPPEDWQESFDAGRPEQMAVRNWQILAALSCMAALTLAAYYYLPPQPRATPCILSMAMVLAVYWCVFYGVCLMVAYRRSRISALIDQDYRNEMQTFMAVIRSQRHDYNFHIQALSGLIGDEKWEECRKYINNMERASIEMNTILPVKDPAIAALIFSFVTMAKDNGTTLHLDIQNDMSNVVTSVYETNKVIGNLLQNAIDEVSTHADKSFGIHLYILKRGENCIIHVANQIAPKEDTKAFLEEIYHLGRTTKESHEGIGLSSIRHLLARHQGVIYSRIEENIIHFVAKIPLRMKGESL